MHGAFGLFNSKLNDLRVRVPVSPILIDCIMGWEYLKRELLIHISFTYFRMVFLSEIVLWVGGSFLV